MEDIKELPAAAEPPEIMDDIPDDAIYDEGPADIDEKQEEKKEDIKDYDEGCLYRASLFCFLLLDVPVIPKDAPGDEVERVLRTFILKLLDKKIRKGLFPALSQSCRRYSRFCDRNARASESFSRSCTAENDSGCVAQQLQCCVEDR
jgi:hypothetical protein